MNEERFVVSDVVWHRLKPHLPGKIGDAGATAKNNRLFLEAVLWWVRTGSPWRDRGLLRLSAKSYALMSVFVFLDTARLPH